MEALLDSTCPMEVLTADRAGIEMERPDHHWTSLHRAGAIKASEFWRLNLEIWKIERH
jgi:hypothetical protein